MSKRATVYFDPEIHQALKMKPSNFCALSRRSVKEIPMADWGSGLQGVANLAAGIREAFPDYREQIDDLIDGGDDIVVKLTIRGTHSRPYMGVPATGKEVEFRDVTICRVLNGKIVKQSGLSDYMTMFTQLGLIEPPQLS